MISDSILHSEEEFKTLTQQGKPINTIYGKAYRTNKGQYIVDSMGTSLQRLMYEDFYMVQLPKTHVVRFIDGNQSNICIQNLQVVIRRVIRNHNVKYIDREKQSINMSKATNTIGYYNVSKRKDGYYNYRYNINENGRTKQKNLTSKSIKGLEKRVIAKGLKWIKFKQKQ